MGPVDGCSKAYDNIFLGLYLNVIRPAGVTTSSKLPVIVVRDSRYPTKWLGNIYLLISGSTAEVLKVATFLLIMVPQLWLVQLLLEAKSSMFLSITAPMVRCWLSRRPVWYVLILVSAFGFLSSEEVLQEGSTNVGLYDRTFLL